VRQGGVDRSGGDGDSPERLVLLVEKDDVEHLLHGVRFEDVPHIGVHAIGGGQGRGPDFEEGRFINKSGFIDAHDECASAVRSWVQDAPDRPLPAEGDSLARRVKALAGAPRPLL